MKPQHFTIFRSTSNIQGTTTKNEFTFSKVSHGVFGCYTVLHCALVCQVILLVTTYRDMPSIDDPEEPTIADVLASVQAIGTQLAALQATVEKQYGSMQAAMSGLNFRLADLQTARYAREVLDDIDEYWEPPSHLHSHPAHMPQ